MGPCLYRVSDRGSFTSSFHRDKDSIGIISTELSRSAIYTGRLEDGQVKDSPEDGPWYWFFKIVIYQLVIYQSGDTERVFGTDHEWRLEPGAPPFYPISYP